jgi:serine protease Do
MKRLLATLVITLAVFLGIVFTTRKKEEPEKPRFEALFGHGEKEPPDAPLLAPTEIYQPPERSVLLSNAPREFLRDLSQEYRTLLEKATPSVVNLTIERNNQALPKLPFPTLLPFSESGAPAAAPSRYEAFACCVTENGHLAASAHLVLGASRLEARGPNGVALPARLIAVDYPSNLAILKVDDVKTVPVQWSDLLQLKSGDLLFKLQRLADQPIRLEIGVLLGRSRLPVFAANLPEIDLLKVAFRSPTRQLNGILLNAQGEMVGWETPAITELGGDPQVSHAIPATSMRQICRALIDGTPLQRVTLGVQFQAITSSLARSLNLPVTEGLLVVSPPESASDQAPPLLQKDDIVLAYNNERLGSVGQLLRLTAMLEPGAHVELSVLRQQQTMTVSVPVLEAPVPLPPWQEIHQAGGAAPKADPLGLFAGIEVGKAEAPAENGVLVTEVKEGSPAAWSGLKAGITLLEIDGAAVESPKTYQKVISSKKESLSSVLWAKKDGHFFYLVLQSNTPNP